MTFTFRLLALVLLLAVAGCAEPLPPDRQAYAGEWRSAHVTLHIGADGQVHYRYQKGTVSKEITAPLKHFEGHDFVVGVGPLSTTFEVSQPPYQDGPVWKMVVDGVELTRSANRIKL